MKLDVLVLTAMSAIVLYLAPVAQAGAHHPAFPAGGLANHPRARGSDLANLFAARRAGRGGGQPAKQACQKECKMESCGSTNIKYGRYCGIGYGCSNAEYEPCDPVDACCKVHDECVDAKGMLDNGCHSALLGCLDSALAAGQATFAKAMGMDDSHCPLQKAVDVMKRGIKSGMGLSSALAKMFNNAH